MTDPDRTLNTLREKAAQIVRNESLGLTKEEQFDILLLAEELETAHIELEAQNEQLRELSRALEASRAEFVDLYESAPVSFVTLDPAGIIRRTNAAARQMLTGNEHSMVGYPFTNFVALEDHRLYFENKRPDQENNVAVLHLRLITSRGRRLHVHIQTLARYDPEGKLEQSNLVFFDVTKQTLLEEELRASRETLAMAARSGGIGIWSYDLKTRKSTWNEQVYLLLGLAPRQGREEEDAFFKYIHPEDRKGILGNFQALLKSGDEVDLEFRIIRADGHIRWLASKGSVQYDSEGRPASFQGVNFDITEKKRSEIELHESQERFRSVLEHSLDIAFRRNLQTQRYDYISPVIEEVTGFSKSEIGELGSEELMALVHPEDRTRVTADVEKACRSGKGKLNFRFQRKDGQYLWVSDHFTVQFDAEGRPMYRIGVMRDITDQKRTEDELTEQRRVLSEKVTELEQINRELSEYAYAVSHDLKAPLRAVRNYADFLIEDLEGELSGEQKTYLEGIKKALSQGDELIRDLLKFSQIGQTMETAEEIELEEAVREVCEILTLSEEINKVIVHSGCPPLATRRTLLKQILLNLIENGIKFNDSEVKRVEVWCRPALKDRVELVVKDNGIGIEERYRERVFRVFHRLHTSSEFQGTGIGLATVRKAAVHLGGSVRLESTPGEGSTFIVDLPRNPPE